MQALSGLKIVDFTRLLPGPLATQLLVKMGAEVIRIEHPRRIDYAKLGLNPVEGVSVLFHQLNTGKEIRTIDYNDAEGKQAIMDLLADADVLIEQFRPGAMDAWELGYAELKAQFPQLVYVSLSGYGQSGPKRNEAGHDVNYLAQNGILSLMKDENGKPTISDTQFADIGGAYMAVMALQAALLQRNQTGTGSFVDVSLCDSMLPYLAIPHSFQAANMDYRQVNVINGKTAVNYTTYECADGKWLAVGALEIKFWNNLCAVVDKPDWARKNQLALLNNIFPKEEVIALFKSKKRDEWSEIFAGTDTCVSPILEVEELENDPYHQAKGNFESFTTKGGTQLPSTALPFDISI
ncbi:MAG: CoA transferase [Bacteroidota bacterium]